MSAGEFIDTLPDASIKNDVNWALPIAPDVFCFIWKVAPKLPVSVAIKLQFGRFAAVVSYVDKFICDKAPEPPCPIIVNAVFVPVIWNNVYGLLVFIPTFPLEWTIIFGRLPDVLPDEFKIILDAELSIKKLFW